MTPHVAILRAVVSSKRAENFFPKVVSFVGIGDLLTFKKLRRIKSFIKVLEK
jgi:hypothetical protein